MYRIKVNEDHRDLHLPIRRQRQSGIRDSLRSDAGLETTERLRNDWTRSSHFIESEVALSERVLTSSGSINLNQWQTVAVSFDASDPSVAPVFSINGVAYAGSVTTAAVGAAISDAPFELHVGNHAMGPVRTFNGMIDELRVSANTRTAAQIAAEFRAAATLTDRVPAPDNSSRQPPESLLVMFTASPLIDS